MVRRLRRQLPRRAALLSWLPCGGFGLLAMLAVQAASAQGAGGEVSTTSSSYGDWLLRCESRRVETRTVKACEVSAQATVKGENGASGTAAILAFGRHPDKAGWQIAFQLPIIVWLPTGAKLGIGDGPPLLEASFFACRPTLCSAAATVTESVFAPLLAATSDLAITYRAQTQQVVKVTLSAKGLPDALAALEKDMKN